MRVNGQLILSRIVCGFLLVSMCGCGSLSPRPVGWNVQDSLDVAHALADPHELRQASFDDTLDAEEQFVPKPRPELRAAIEAGFPAVQQEQAFEGNWGLCHKSSRIASRPRKPIDLMLPGEPIDFWAEDESSGSP